MQCGAVEIRGGAKNVKVHSVWQNLSDHDRSLATGCIHLLLIVPAGCLSGMHIAERHNDLFLDLQVQSSPKRVLANSINWQEELVL